MATKTLREIFSILSEELTTNTALVQWCMANFETTPVIRFGVDDNDVPNATDSLEIHLISGSRSRTRQFAYRSYGFSINAIIKKSSEDDETEINNVYVLENLELIDVFVSLIEEAVINVLNKNSIIVTPMEGDEDAVGYPYVVANLKYLLEVPSKLPIY